MSQLPARTLEFDSTPPALPELPAASAPSAPTPVSQDLTSGQPPHSSAAAPSSALPELSATCLVQTQVDTQSTDPSSHTVSTNGLTTAATAPVTTAEATQTVSAPLAPPSQTLSPDASRQLTRPLQSPLMTPILTSTSMRRRWASLAALLLQRALSVLPFWCLTPKGDMCLRGSVRELNQSQGELERHIF